MSHTAGAMPLARFWLRAGALVVAAVVLSVQFARAPHGFDLPLYDFAEYWAAGRLVVQGQNPYDPILVWQQEQEAGRDGEPLLMWNPPWTLALVMPFGLAAPRVAHLLWLLLSFGIVLTAADVAWCYYGGSAGKRGVAWLLAFAFIPTFLTFYLGQIAAVLLAGAVLFLYFERRGDDLRAGAATLLLAVKPHLFIFFWVALCLWAIGRQRWRIFAGGALAGLGATLVALLFDPMVLSHYRDTLIGTPPVQYHSPTLGTVLRLLLGEDRFGLQFLAPLPGLLWFVPMWLRHRQTWDWGERLPALLFASLLTAPYGAWPFDLIVLLVCVLRIAATGAPARGALALYLAVNIGAAMFLMLRVDFFWWLWLTPALLMAYAAALPTVRRQGWRSPVAPITAGQKEGGYAFSVVQD